MPLSWASVNSPRTRWPLHRRLSPLLPDPPPDPTYFRVLLTDFEGSDAVVYEAYDALLIAHRNHPVFEALILGLNGAAKSNGYCGLRVFGFEELSERGGTRRNAPIPAVPVGITISFSLQQLHASDPLRISTILNLEPSRLLLRPVRRRFQLCKDSLQIVLASDPE
jgi:hypothetical protein